MQSPHDTTRVSGATRLETGQTLFKVWAPTRSSVELVVGGRDRIAMKRGEHGYWSAIVDSVTPGTRYGYALDGAESVLADPASRFQPDGPHGLSEIVDPSVFEWTDASWNGLKLEGQVLYELHVGTFTQEGTWDGARRRLSDLAELGVTAVELMPVADFSGRFGWGYDGVDLYAPHHHYGRPDEFRRFVDAAHGLGLGVILDVVYNHFGPDGNYLPRFSPYYFSRRATDWGAAFNYDGEHNRPVRDFIAGNAEYWIREYHVDGFRLDATQSIFDDSREHMVTEIARRARATASPRSILLIAENEPQQTDLVRPSAQGGNGLDAVWNDDFHHSAMVALLGSREAYYTDYLGRAHEFVAAMKYGHLYQGQHYVWQKKRRGTPAFDLQPRRFVAFLENHDQVANTSRGERLRYRTHPAACRAMTAMLLLGPWTPMLFQGQEWCSEKRFAYFADFDANLAKAVQEGRGNQMKQFPSYASRAVQDGLPIPGALATFESSKLDWEHGPLTQLGQQSIALHRDLLTLRREDPVLRECLSSTDRRLDAAVLTDSALVLRYFANDEDRLLIVNLGPDYDFVPAPEPLLAPKRGAAWQILWASEEPRYGGNGVAEGWTDARGWHLPGYCALLFEPAEVEESSEAPEPNV
jgi:maltooligosyltrehalose trehalohydrolase